MNRTLRRHGTTIAIVVLTAVAGAVWAVDRGSITTTERAARTRNLLPAFREDDVTELKVTTRGKAARVFRGPVDAVGQRPWRVEIDGVTWPAEESVVDQYLAALRDGVADRKLQGGVADAGEARTLIAVEMGRQRYLVTLRGPAPTPPGAVYAEVQGGDAAETAVVSAQLAAVLDAAPESFRQKALVSWGPADLATIAIDGEGGPRHLARATWLAPRGGSFRFDGSTPEGNVRASAAALDKIWDAIGKLQAESFLPDADADRALARKVTLTLAGKAGGRVTIDLGGACPGHEDDVVAVRRDDHGGRFSACVPRGALDLLTLPASEIVDRRVVGARAEEVFDLKLNQGATTIAMARSGSQWHEQTPTDRPVDPDVGRSFLERLLDVSATRLVTGDPRALGLDPPRATVRVTSLVPAGGPDGGDAERTELIEVGAEQGGVVHVRRVEDGAIAEITAEAAAALLPDEIALRPRRIYETSIAAMRALRVETPGRVQRVERSADGAWLLVEPKGAGLVVDAALLGELAEAVGGLTADRWIGPARPEYGLDRPRIAIDAALGDAPDAGPGKRAIKIAIGAPAGPAGSFARTGDEPSIFVARKQVEDAADRWLIDRTALVTEVSHVRRVTLTAPGGKRAVIEAVGGVFQIAGAAADAAANARAAAVREALADLVAEGAVSVGKAEKHEGLDRPALEVAIEIDGKTVKLAVGAGDALKGTSVYYVRREGVDATFAVAQAKVRPLLDAVGAGR